MKKVNLLLFALLLIAPILCQIRTAHATSCGYERYKDDICEVYVEYFPIVPYNPAYPTASEEFAIKFYISQTHWWTWDLDHYVPQAWGIYVFYLDDCGYSDYVTWKRWYPTSTSQTGWQVSWSLSGGYGPLSVGATITAPAAETFETNYTKYYRNSYLHVGSLKELLSYDPLRGNTYTEGAGSLGVPNDQAQSHEGHHVTLWVHFRLLWVGYTLGVVPIGPVEVRDIDFIIGDDIPADTDCWLNVKQGDSAFSVNTGSSGGGGCPTLFVWNGTSYVEEGILNIHAESDVTVQHTIQNTPVLKDGFYNLQLRELDNYTSHIDQVKLYAIDGQGEWHLCPLTYAYHSSLGKVKQTLLLDDSNRVDLKPTEIIDLKFAPSIAYSETAYFIFEINGYNQKTP